MNIILLVTTTLALCSLRLVTYGQTFSEWFFQHSTRMKYLRLQAAALDVLESTTRAGYEGAADGLGGAEDKEFTIVEMDETWLTSLGTVRNVFRNGIKTKMLYHIARHMANKSAKYIAQYDASPWLGEGEKEQLRLDLGEVKEAMENALKSLLRCITDGEMEMTDAQRWMAINELLRDAATRHLFQRIKIETTEELIATRQQQAANDKFIKNIQP